MPIPFYNGYFAFLGGEPMSRLFNKRDKSALFIAADGKCSNCGDPLPIGWHADHIMPYSKGGETDVSNGQALCAKCNLKKGGNMPDSIVLRPWQQYAEERTKELVEFLKEQHNQGKQVTIEQKSLVMWLDPGMGKTLLYLHCLNYLFRIGFVERAGVYTPRVNLCTQSELDWKDNFRHSYNAPVMGEILHAPNGSGLINEPGQFGFISTYQSLIATSTATTPFNEHAAIFDRHSTALVVDEAQLLGVHGLTQEKNKSTEYIQMLATRAKIIFVLTGTPLRSDGKRLAMAHYSEKDTDGKVYLIPAVRASYLDGVKFGSLRPFEFELFDGRAIYQYLDGEREYLQLTSMKDGLGKVLENRGWWSGAVDRTVEKVRELQAVYKPYCGLIACASQAQATEVMAYLRDKHPSIRALKAISDEVVEARENLRDFKTGRFDILVTVAMAHIGYDHKPITVICCLTAIRNEGWLRQLFGRGWRWDTNAPPDQYVYVIAPDDKAMQRIVYRLREESQDGIKEREPEIMDSEDREIEQQRLGITVNAELTDGRAVGMDAATDVVAGEYPGLLEAAKTWGLRASPLTGLMGLLRTYKGTSDPIAPRAPQLDRGASHQEELRLMHTTIKKLSYRADKKLIGAGLIDPGQEGYTYKEMIKRNKGQHVDKKLPKAGLQKRIDWLNNFWLPYVEQRCNE